MYVCVHAILKWCLSEHWAPKNVSVIIQRNRQGGSKQQLLHRDCTAGIVEQSAGLRILSRLVAAEQFAPARRKRRAERERDLNRWKSIVVPKAHVCMYILLQRPFLNYMS